MNVIRDFLQHTELLSKGSHLDICTGFEGLDIISFEKARSQTPDILSSFIKIMIFTTGIQGVREKTEDSPTACDVGFNVIFKCFA